MKNNKGITLVSLVVTIIVLIILAGVSINLTLGENGIITITKQAKENTELAKIEEEIALNELYTQMEAEGGSISYDSIAKLTEFKKSIADYIEEAGGTKPEYTADATTFRESIKGIVKEVTKDATATAEDIVNGKIAYVNGEKIIGKLDGNNYSKIYYGYQKSDSATSGFSVIVNIPEDAKKGILIANLYSYNTSGGFTINISDATGIASSTQLLDVYTGGQAQSAVTSIWNCTFNPGETITLYFKNPNYSLCNATYMIVY